MGLAATLPDTETSTLPAAMPSTLSALAPGQPFAGYQLLERIGEGGMGIVYKARQPSLNRIIALKLLRSGAWAGETEIKRFHREAQSAARLAHPNLVAIHEVGEENGQHFFSMEFVEGSSLAQVIHRTPLPPERAARYVRIIAEAIQYAHDRGVLHRDLKPSNVLIDATDQPRVTDFGLARQIDSEPRDTNAEPHSSLTLSGAILGTPSYMPPEQAQGRRQMIGPTSDVYSLGAILYDCLTGRPPFRADTPVDTLRQVVESEPAAPRLLNRKVPRDLEPICLKCLAKEPGQRFRTARELAEDLSRFLRGEPIRARPVGAWNRGWRWSRRNPVMAALGASLVLVLALLAVAALRFRADAIDFVEQGAKFAANSVSLELMERGMFVQTLSTHHELRAFLARGDREGLTNWLNAAYGRSKSAGGRRFENYLLLDNTGQAVARSPQGTNNAPPGRGVRDYFQGAFNRSPYFSRIYESADDGMQKLAVSCLIRTETGQTLGVLAAMVGTDLPETLASLTEGNGKVALAGQADHSALSGQTPGLAEFLILWHPAFRAQESAVPAGPRYEGRFAKLLLSTNTPTAVDLDPRYRDPVAKQHSKFLGLWLAGFARVPGTPYVVIYQTRDRVTDALATAGILAAIALATLMGWRLLRHRFRKSDHP